MTQLESAPDQEELERLFVNNENLDRISAYLNRFNPIRIMRMEEYEIRHSEILAWLLNPRETHGFGDRFLKAFLSEALRGRRELGQPTALEVSQSDLRDAVVEREWKKIDIFIMSRMNGWAFIVENKYNSKQSEGQLSNYKRAVTSYYERRNQSVSVCGVFLTLHDEEPEDKSFAPLRYSDICEFLPRLIRFEGGSFSQEVAVFLQHYLEVIKDATDMNEKRIELEKLARQLYRTHKKVLEFVMNYGATTDFIVAAETLFGQMPESEGIVYAADGAYMYSYHTSELLSFLPEDWSKELREPGYSWEGCENWWAGYPLICWLQLFKNDDGTRGNLRLFAEVGPIADHNVRRNLIDEIRSVANEAGLTKVKFQQGAAAEGKRFSRFLKGNNVDIDDVHDADEIARAMATLLRRFKPDFEIIATAFPRLKQPIFVP